MLKPALFILSILLSGCATILDDSTQQVSILTQNQKSSDLLCTLTNEETTLSNIKPFTLVNIPKDGNDMTVTCANEKTSATTVVEPTLEYQYIILDMFMVCPITSLAIDGYYNSWYTYPRQIMIDMGK